jgi:hypothetical protein
VPGVTTIIGNNLGWNKNQLMHWAWNEGKEGRNYKDTSQKAADAGTIAHYLIECDIKNKKPDVAMWLDRDLLNQAETCYLNFLEWKEMVRFELIESEIHLVSETHKYGGTIDCYAYVNGQPCIVDFKTSNGLYPDYLIQLSAYKKLLEENVTKLIGGLHLLRIDKETASFHHHFWQDLPEAWEAFLNLLNLHNLQKKLKKLT